MEDNLASLQRNMTTYCFKQMIADVASNVGLANVTRDLNMSLPVYLDFVWRFCDNITDEVIQDEIAKAKHRSLYLIDVENLYTPHYDIPILGIASPVVILLTAILNILTVVVLCSKTMQSPTNVILVAIALADMLTGFCEIPWYLFAFHDKRHLEYPPFGWCVMYYYVSILAGTCLHTASIMFNSMLAIHRYIGICHHGRAKTWCGYRPVFAGIVIIIFLSILPHLFKYLELYIMAVDAISKSDLDLRPSESETVSTCMFLQREGFDTIYNTQIYYWFRAIFIQILPCLVLLVVNALLISTVVKSYRYRIRLAPGNRNASMKDLKETQRITVMLVVVITFFLAAEIPVAIAYTLYVMQFITQVPDLVTRETVSILTTVANFLVFTSSPINFFVYFAMNLRFRKALCALFCCKTQNADSDHPTVLMLRGRTSNTHFSSSNTHSHRSGSRSNISVCTTYSDVRGSSVPRQTRRSAGQKRFASAFLRTLAVIFFRLSDDNSYDLRPGPGERRNTPTSITLENIHSEGQTERCAGVGDNV